MKNSNRLGKETSPYLLQHAENPVNWHPWGDEAFETAARENKPVFISIGYSTCHWCHVMAHESFENDEVAGILNENFVSIKVDREEFPDVDHYYIEACQMITGRGGWPLTIFADSERAPFFAGTYFPRESRMGRPGFKDILLKIAEVWKNEPDVISKNISEIGKGIGASAIQVKIETADDSIFAKAYSHFESGYDDELGGFGPAPKFPSLHNLLFLTRYYQVYGDKNALAMVEHTVKRICSGGIFDHIGGGFHRYSTDIKWLVPHFEKMLYDQAMMILLLAELYRLTGDSFYLHYLERTLEFVETEMTSPAGAFYSAFDADSEGVEGKYYTWELNELRSILTGDEIGFLKEFYSLEEEGNYLEEHLREKNGTNIFHFDFEKMNDFNAAAERFEVIRKKILSHRKNRVPPLMDNKILTDWNGLMIYSLSFAAFVTGTPKFMDMAKKAYEYIFVRHKEGNELYHSSAGEKLNTNSVLDDYAFLGLASLNLFQFSGRPEYLKEAVSLAGTMTGKFFDEEKNLFRISENFFPEKSISIFDNAYPSGNSAAFYLISRLNNIIPIKEFGAAALPMEKIPSMLIRYPHGAAFMLQSLFDQNKGLRKGVLVAEGGKYPFLTQSLLKGLYGADMSLIWANRDSLNYLSGADPFWQSFMEYFENPSKMSEIPLFFECGTDGCLMPVNLQ